MTPADQASVRVDWGLSDGNRVVCHTVRVVIQKLHLLKDRVILKGRNKIQRVEISVNGVKYYGGLNDLPGRISRISIKSKISGAYMPAFSHIYILALNSELVKHLSYL